ncbi:MAG: Tim44 domain-containing protein [Burkholderiaceae bacterium]|nr:MAG: Tim44 domain-containing protein [Burkholderiaceae bacterium]
MKLNRLATRFLTLLMVVLMAAAFSLDAQAKRMGGGKSIGRQSSQVTQRQATPPAAPTAPAAANAKTGQANGAAAGRPWTGMLGGLAAGLGLAWLAHALGLGAGFANILLIGLLVVAAMAAFRVLQRARQGTAAGNQTLAFQGIGGARQGGMPPSSRPVDFGGAAAPTWGSPGARFGAAAGPATGAPLHGAQTWGIPEDFDVAGFTDAAKRNFTSVQDAWDRGDLLTLRAIMTDEMLEEIRGQLAEREHIGAPGQVHKTDVVTLDAQLLGIEELDDVFMTSVEFSGLIREDGAAEPAAFREVWNMTRAKNGSDGWRLAGVQALR